MLQISVASVAKMGGFHLLTVVSLLAARVRPLSIQLLPAQENIRISGYRARILVFRVFCRCRRCTLR